MNEEVSPNRESQPNASGPEGLSGDMGISSERTGGFEWVEGTGSAASTQGSTDGEAPPLPAPPDADEEVPDKPDQTSPVTHVDRTVGEVQPDEVPASTSSTPAPTPATDDPRACIEKGRVAGRGIRARSGCGAADAAAV